MANNNLSELIYIDTLTLLAMFSNQQRWHALLRKPSLAKDIHRSTHMARILDEGVYNCVEYIRMTKDTLLRFCTILRECCHLRDSIHIAVEEHVALFLHIVEHYAKNRQWKFILIDHVLWSVVILMPCSKLFVASKICLSNDRTHQYILT